MSVQVAEAVTPAQVETNAGLGFDTCNAHRSGHRQFIFERIVLVKTGCTAGFLSSGPGGLLSNRAGVSQKLHASVRQLIQIRINALQLGEIGRVGEDVSRLPGRLVPLESLALCDASQGVTIRCRELDGEGHLVFIWAILLCSWADRLTT